MNPEEDIPTRVTRGALRRRSVDQEATPQKASATSVTGTPNKANSTTKRVTALNPIQESEGRPSTPIAGRTGRRRMSETVDTPTSLPNKLVQNLKGAGTGSGSGKRSRNASLTEENLKELNVAYEGSSATLSTRSRTPARVRASHDSLVTSGSPLTVTPAVRRSTRRNSVTSDDGNISVQSLPITTPKTGSGLRTLKDDTIIEEDAGDDRAESVLSETSTRHMRSQSILSLMSAPASPRSTTASPVLTGRNESTPPRTITTPRVALTPLSLSKKSPRSKNVSFSDNSKPDDSQSSFPKTPTSVAKEVFIMVADLRNSELKGVSPKADAVVDLSPKTVETEKQEPAVDSSPKSENVESNNQTLNETVQGTIEEKTNAFSAIDTVQNEESAVGKVGDNDVSGIDVLESSVKEVVDTEAGVHQNANRSLTEGNKFPKSWTQSVRRSAMQAIDEYAVPKPEEQERREEPKDSLAKARKDSSFQASSPAAEQQPAEDSEEQEEDDEEMQQRNEFADDEALEVEGYQSGDSMDEELRKEIEQNEIPDQGEDLGSEDTEEYDEEDEKSDDYDDANDSWIVSDGNEVDEDQLLRSSNEDLTTSSSASPKKPTIRQRKVNTIHDDSEEDQDKDASVDVGKKSSPSKSPKSTTSIRRSPTPISLLQTSDKETVEKTMVANSPAPATPSKKTELNSPVKLSSNKKKLPEEPVEAATSAKEDETTECSVVMLEDADEAKEKTPQKDKDTKNRASLSTSPTKSGISRQSLPVDAANLTEPHAVDDVRKSLPASTKMPTSEKTDVDEAEKISVIDKIEIKEDVIDLEESAEVQTSFSDHMEQNESSSSQITLEQPVNEEVKPDRKSMPLVSLISAQFYIGGTKKRNTVGGGESNMLTSTPKPNDSSTATNKNKKSVVEKMNSNGSNSVVPNPFALANSTKLKSRVSLDSAEIKQSAKKSRLSLPSKLFEEGLSSGTETGVNGSQEPEPMEVDEVIEEEEEEAVANEEANKQNDDEETDNDDVSVQEVQPDGKQRSKMVKPKPKALEDYDLTNILDRCNEVLREDKERKKQQASVVRKKKEEKKRLRELEKQEELDAAKNAAASSAADKDADPNNANVSTGNDSTGQGEEPTKKKKKRKPKVKNYLLEELAETKKERMEQALRHQLEVAERRKQRKKNRQLEKKKQLGKENGDAVSVTGGIGAKLEKMKKKKKAKENGEAKVPKENESKDPPVRVALSAYAVFNQRSNNQTPVSAVDGKQKESSDTAQLVVSPVEKKQLLKTSSKKDKRAAESLGKEVDNQTDKQVATMHKSLSVDDVAVSKKKQQLAAQSEEDPQFANNKMNPLLLQSASDGLMAKKQKRKQPIMSATGSLENVLSGAHKLSVDGVAKPAEGKISAENEPYSNEEKPNEKKKKKELVTELPLNGADSDNPKQKKNKTIKLNGAAEFFRAKLASAMDENHPEEEQVRKNKKGKKKLTSQMENGAKEDSGNMTELPRKKSPSVVMEPTLPVPSIVPAKKRKREQQGDSTVTTTPRPAKHTKLRVLQRIESGGFFVENVTPDKVRLKRNFGFQERPATPAKQLGFKVTSLLPTGQDELRGMAASSKMYSKDGRKKSKFGDVVGPERTLSLPLPVWTSSGVFLESAADAHGADGDKNTPKDNPGYMQLKSQGKGEFNIKSLRPGAIAEKPHRVDPATIDKSVLNFKRQQLLEKTAHLREKKNQRV